MASHCAERYSSSTNFLMHLDVDEFLVAPESLYSSEEPYREDEADPQSRWHFPLHDVLLRPSIAESACVPVPELQYRNVGVRLLLPGQSVTSSHTKRNVVHSGHVADKVRLSLSLQPLQADTTSAGPDPSHVHKRLCDV